MKKLDIIFPKWQGSGECDLRVRCPRSGRKVNISLCKLCKDMIEIGTVWVNCAAESILK